MKIHIKHYKENISINQLYLPIAIHRKYNTKINKQQFRIPAQHHYSNWTGAKKVLKKKKIKSLIYISQERLLHLQATTEIVPISLIDL